MIDNGDADRQETMHLPSGTWLAQVVVIPPEAPNRVGIIFSPATVWATP
jgi:hypothetical protein